MVAHVAVVQQNVKLADAVAEASIEHLAIVNDRQAALEAIYRLIECAGADPDQPRGKGLLAKRLEQVAFIVKDRSLLVEIGEYLDTLKLIDPALEERLGRAMAMAKLGANPAAGAVA
jgi:hypothetical protein